MPSFLTVSWDENHLLLLAARTAGKNVVFEKAQTIALKDPADKSGIFRAVSNESERVVPDKVANALLSFVQQNNLAKSEAIFVVGRSDVEVRPLSFPPIPVNELPDVIRFQAAREFNRYEPNSPLDFFLLHDVTFLNNGNGLLTDNLPATSLINAQGMKSVSPGNGKTGVMGAPDATGRRRVLASIIRADLLKEITSLCEKSKLNLRRIVLHPCEESYLWRSSVEFSPEKTYLLVEVDPTEALLTILFQGQPVFMRSPRLSGDRAERARISSLVPQLLSEIKRTLIAVRNEIQGVSIDQLIMLGNSEEHQKLGNDISNALGVPLFHFDPWADVQRSGSLQKKLPESPELYAPLVGATLLAGRNIPSEIDYLNPKKRPPDRSRQQLFTSLALLAGFLLTVAIGFGFWRNSEAKKELIRLEHQKVKLKKEVEEVQQLEKTINSVKNWESNRFDWLAQMAWLSEKIPQSQDMMLTQLDIKTSMPGIASMTIKGNAKNVDTVTQTLEKMRDATHQTTTDQLSSQPSQNPAYPQQFAYAVAVTQETKTPVRNTARRNNVPAAVEKR